MNEPVAGLSEADRSWLEARFDEYPELLAYLRDR